MSLKADSASGYRFAAVATLASAVAGITLLAGILELQLFGLHLRPLIQVDPLPLAAWPHHWLDAAQSAQALQATAVQEWLGVVGVLLATIVVLAGISALIALFAHASARRYEVALAAVLGASRAQLTLAEMQKAAVNAGAALVVGIAVGLFGAWLAAHTWPQVSAGWSVGGWLAVSIVFTCTLAAVVARAVANRISRPGWMGDVLAPEARTNPGYGAEDLRGLLLVVQFTLTFALLTSAVLVWQQTRTTTATHNARTADSLVTRLAIDDRATAAQRENIHKQVRWALHAAGETAYAAATPGTLIGVGPTDQVLANCGACTMSNMFTPMFPVRTQQHVVSAGFFERAGFQILSGREFNNQDAATRHVVVNDTFAGMAFQGQPSIGKRIQVGGLRGPWYTVVGVVKDIPISGLIAFDPEGRNVVRAHRADRQPAIYFSAQEKTPAVFEVITERPFNVQIAGVRLLQSQRLPALLAEARSPVRWFAGLLGTLSVAAALIAVLSLGALTLLNVQQRRLEIAARRAVGARRRDILLMVLRTSAATAARGIFAGIILSVAIARAIQMLVPQMKLFDLEVTLLSALLLTIISLIAASIPARAAARVPPARVHA